VNAPPEDLPDNLEDVEELADEWEVEEVETTPGERVRLTPEQLRELRQEMAKAPGVSHPGEIHH